MKNNPVLTIIIPTYNRPVFLSKQLDLLLPQLSEKVKLVVIDNNSDVAVELPDLRANIFSSNVSLIRNESNIGGDANIFKSYCVSETDWTWVLSDDDFLQADSIVNVLKLIELHKDVVLINFVGDSNVFKKVTGYYEYCDSAIYWASFSISHIVWQTNKLRPYLDYYKEQIASKQPQLLTTLKYLFENSEESCLFVGKNLFSHSVEAGWNYLEFVYCTMSIYQKIEFFDLDYFKNTLGKQVVNTCFYLLYKARYSQNLKYKDYFLAIACVVRVAKFNLLILSPWFWITLLYLIFPCAHLFLKRRLI
jgi:glycosyltransferase involved in cell wall biosynthesis